MSEEHSGARETLEEAREMREHEDKAKEHDAAEQGGSGGGLMSDDADRSEKPAPPGGMSNPSPSS
jgi:hypothetical protein